MDLTKTKEMSEGRDLMYKVAKRVLMLSLVLSLLLSTAVFSFATSDTPTSWFQEDIKDAIDKNFVPNDLQGNYQSDITRAEYAVLALSIYSVSGAEFSWEEMTPFDDCIGHKYEQQLVAAYNAGIIAGDGKGTFNPDDKISRQQVAVMLVNLLKQISPKRDFEVKNTYSYPDQNDIAPWARYYIDYCFENEILRGGTGNSIAPLGNATIEQSIVLLYRIAKSENLLVSPYGSIETVDGPVGVGNINGFVDTYGEETYALIKDLSKDVNIDIITLSRVGTVIDTEMNSLNLSDYNYEISLLAFIHDINDEKCIDIYKLLLATSFDNTEDAIKSLDKYIVKMKSGEDILAYENFDQNGTLAIRTSFENDGVVYTIDFTK